MATHVEAPTSAQTATTAQGRGVAQPAPSHPADDAPVSAATSSGDPFKRTLTVFDMVVYCLIFMVPIAPFSIFGNVFQASNGMPALAYLIGMVAMLFTVLSFGVMIARFPSSGSIYAYTTGGMGKGIGFVTGWLMLLQYLVTPDLMYIMAAIALHQYLPEVPVWVWCAGFLIFVTAVTLRGISATIIVDRIALVIELLVLGAFLVLGVTYVIGHPETSSFSTNAIFDPKTFDMGAMMSAVSLCVFSYVGFGSVATLAEEAKDGRHGPSRAMLIAVLLLGAMFMSMCFVATCVDPTGQVFANNGDDGFYLVAQLVGGKWFGVLCAVAVAVALGVFTALAGQTSASRILYAMGNSGSLPKALAKVDDKTRVPVVATLFVSGLSAAMLFFLLQLGMDDIAKVTNFGALASYCLLNICVIWYYWIKQKDHSNPVRLLICPAIGAIVTLVIFISLDTVAHVVGFVWVAIGIAYYLVVTKVLHRGVEME